MWKGLVLLALAAVCFVEGTTTPALKVTFNKFDRYHRKVRGDPVDFTFRGDKHLIYKPGAYGQCLRLNGNYFVHAGERFVPRTCLSDIDLCTNGFMLSVWIRPFFPWQGADEMQYIVSFGQGKDGDFGLRLGIHKKTVLAQALGRFSGQQVEATIPNNYKRRAWMHLVVMRTVADGDLTILLNGYRMQYTSSHADPASMATKTTTDLVIGSDGEGHGRSNFQGFVDDVRFYNETLSLTEIRNIYHHGMLYAKKRGGIVDHSWFGIGLDEEVRLVPSSDDVAPPSDQLLNQEEVATMEDGDKEPPEPEIKQKKKKQKKKNKKKNKLLRQQLRNSKKNADEEVDKVGTKGKKPSHPLVHQNRSAPTDSKERVFPDLKKKNNPERSDTEKEKNSQEEVPNQKSSDLEIQSLFGNEEALGQLPPHPGMHQDSIVDQGKVIVPLPSDKD